MQRFLPFVIGVIASFTAFSQPTIELVPYATGFTYPLHITNAGDERLFIVQRVGKVKIIDGAGLVLSEPFLDLTDQIESGYEERGFLGLAFHPDYASNGYFFVSYTDNSGNSVISRFSVSVDDPNIADPDSEFFIYTADQPFSNHNGGCIQFGPDGYLYIALGDGGSGGDPGNRAQNPTNKLGKIHRIDIDSGSPYGIPADNPFVGAIDTLETIWAIGVRNPWRFSFDRETGDMWIGEVGQNLYEEIDFELAGDGGHNYGWKCYEGNHSYALAGCDDESAYTFPIHEYGHSFSTGGFSVTGGYRYRGAEFPEMVGYYLFTDFVTGNWWWTRQGIGGEWETEFLDDIEDDIAGFGEDMNGEMYCADLYSGIIYHITDACAGFSVSATVDSFYCDAAPGSIDVTVTGGTEPFDYLWATGETDEDLLGVSAGTYTVGVFDGAGCIKELAVEVPVGTLLIPDITFDEGTGILSTPDGLAWQWYVDGVLISDANSDTYPVSADGTYTVEVTWDNGCTSFSEEVVVVLQSISDNLDMLQISPNPFGQYLYIESSLKLLAENFVCTDINGRQMPMQLVQMASQSWQVDTESWPAGTYLLQYRNQAENYAIQLVKLEQ